MISFCLAIHTGLRRIDSFLRPVQMIRLDQRNLRGRCIIKIILFLYSLFGILKRLILSI